MGVQHRTCTIDRLLEWMEEKIKEGILIELTCDEAQFTITMLHLKTLQLTKEFKGSTLLLAIKAAWENELE